MKTFRLLGMVLIAILVSVNFASCSSDDEEESYEKQLIGTWIEVNSPEECRCYTFNSDHTVICWATHYGVEGERKWTFKWSATKTHITLIGGKDGDEPEAYRIDGDHLYFYDGVFERQK